MGKKPEREQRRDEMPNVGQRVRELRRERGWSQSDLAVSATVDNATLCRIEGGKQTPTLRVALLLANALRVLVDDLLVGPGAPCLWEGCTNRDCTIRQWCGEK